VALQRSSVSSSRRQVEKIVNEHKLCKLDCRKQEVGCLKGTDPSNIFAGPSCRNTAAICKLGCTQTLFTDVTRIPDPRIRCDGQDAVLARQKDEAAKAVRALDLTDAILVSQK